ncbi:hypothetical protein G3O06_20575 [Burkholderia sp. Ac-20345]|uniref:hypothetical protein n=1 Tax=Burkholderia sp. Ac-20345 TaxID=2703891 RepID=UPI00197B1E2E|nr:hypothetical protein [Burkholderia sp. Ac-20345]MBN3779935.1 hypothetical protein [Burkholderia sp. Ac-20345]
MTTKKSPRTRQSAVLIGDENFEEKLNLAKRENAEQMSVALSKYGFEDYTIDRLIAEGALRARRFVEDILELGRIILTCRELPHGMYGPAIAQMGISKDTARRVAGVALKFWNRDDLKPLLSLDIGKVYELALLDDDSLASMADDPEKLDELECMSVSELRAALREAHEQIKAKDAVAEEMQGTMRKQKEKLARAPKPTPEFLSQEAIDDLNKTSVEVAAAVTTSLRAALGAAIEAVDAHGADQLIVDQACASALGLVFAAARQLCADFGLLPQEAVDPSAEGDASWAAVREQLANKKTR